MSTATFTEFLRSPKSVVEQTKDGAVRITRRRGHDLMLARADDLERQQEGMALASRLMHATLAHDGDMTAALRSLFSWTTLLDSHELNTFAADMDRLVWPAAELGRYRELLLEFRRWEATAEAYADGLAPDQPLEWLNHPAAVPETYEPQRIDR